MNSMAYSVDSTIPDLQTLLQEGVDQFTTPEIFSGHSQTQSLQQPHISQYQQTPYLDNSCIRQIGGCKTPSLYVSSSDYNPVSPGGESGYCTGYASPYSASNPSPMRDSPSRSSPGLYDLEIDANIISNTTKMLDNYGPFSNLDNEISVLENLLPVYDNSYENLLPSYNNNLPSYNINLANYENGNNQNYNQTPSYEYQKTSFDLHNTSCDTGHSKSSPSYGNSYTVGCPSPYTDASYSPAMTSAFTIKEEPQCPETTASKQADTNQQACVPNDPQVWTTNDIENWIIWAKKEFNLSPALSSDRLPTSGLQLCAMTKN